MVFEDFLKEMMTGVNISISDDTNYVIEGEQSQLKSFEATLKRFERMPRPLVENGFGNLWVGNIIQILHGDWHTIHCRGEILDCHIEDGVLKLSVESAWSELSE